MAEKPRTGAAIQMDVRRVEGAWSSVQRSQGPAQQPPAAPRKPLHALALERTLSLRRLLCVSQYPQAGETHPPAPFAF